MTVHPGFGGQRFIEEVLEKVKEISRLRSVNQHDFVIEVDGGVGLEHVLPVLMQEWTYLWRERLIINSMMLDAELFCSKRRRIERIIFIQCPVLGSKKWGKYQGNDRHQFE